MKFRTEQSFNRYVDLVIAGPITAREIEDLIAVGIGFEPRTDDTEYSIAALSAHPRASGQTPDTMAYFHGVMRVLEARLGVCGAPPWDELAGVADEYFRLEGFPYPRLSPVKRA
jgi:hypothetical protein